MSRTLADFWILPEFWKHTFEFSDAGIFVNLACFNGFFVGNYLGDWLALTFS
jgi:hypothetical protein